MIAALIALSLLSDPTAERPTLARASLAPVAPAASPASTPAPPLAGVAVTLECTATARGEVENCAVLGETHPGLGFGAAAVALMDDVQVEPTGRTHQFAHTIQFTP